MNYLDPNLPRQREAKLKYLSSDFQVLREGDYRALQRVRRSHKAGKSQILGCGTANGVWLCRNLIRRVPGKVLKEPTQRFWMIFLENC